MPGEVPGLAPSTVQAHLARAIAALGDGLRPSDSRESIMNGDEELLTTVWERALPDPDLVEQRAGVRRGFLIVPDPGGEEHSR
jgi:hypothetical protein